jgi:O-antigen/teichoic acid export membrane protein
MLVMAVVGLVLIPIIWRDLGVSSYGVWALLATGLRYPMILERAFTLSINRFVAFYRDDVKELNRFVSASFIILTGLAVLTVGAMALLSLVISDVFSAIPAELSGEAQITCVLVGVTLAFKILEATFSGALRGYQYYTRCNAVLIVTNLLRAVLTVGILVVWKSMIAVQLIFLTTAFVSALLMFFVAHKSIVGLEIDVPAVRRQTIRELLRYTGHATVRSGSTIFMYSTMALLVGRVGTAENVAVYDIAFKLPSFVRGLLGGTQNVFLPAVTSLCAKGQLEKIKAIVKKGTHISSVLTCASLILLFIFTQEILAFWLKGSVPPGTVLVMQVLIISVIPGGLFEIWLPALVGMGHLRWLTIASITATSVAILLELILLKGLVAIPMAPAIALGVVLWLKTGFWLPCYGLYKLGIHPYEYLKDSLHQPLTASMVSVAALWAFDSIVPKENVHWLTIFIASTVVVMVSFTAISLRSEVAELLVAARRRFDRRREGRV